MKTPRLYRPFHLATLTLSLLTVAPAQAADYAEDALNEADFFGDIPEVVSATRMAQKLTEAPASISIIDQQMIRASGATNIPDLLRLVPGFQIYHVNSDKYGVTYHGVADDFPRRLEVLVDGRSVYLPLLSTVDWTSIGLSLDDIERIEVVRGSNVPTYGSNAFLGAINIVTKSPLSEAGASVKAMMGAQNEQLAEGRFSTALGSGQTRFTAGHERNTGGDQFHDGANLNYFNLSSTLVPTLADTLQIEAGATDGYTTVGQLGSSDSDNHLTRRDHASNFQYFRWSHFLATDNQLQLTAYRNYLDLSVPLATVDDLVRYEGVPAGLAPALLALNPTYRLDNEDGTTEQYDVELQQTLQFKPHRTSLLWGLGYRQEFASSDMLLQNEGRLDEEQWRLFGNLQTQLYRHVTLNLGAMAETSTTTDVGPRLSPRAAINFEPDGQSVVRLGYSQAYRMPSLLAENSNLRINFGGGAYEQVTAPNHGIRPEQARTTELGYYRTFNSIPGYVDVRLFHEEIEQALSTYLTFDDVQLQKNNSHWRNDGAEFQLRLQPLNRLWFLLNYSYVDTSSYFRDKGPGKGNERYFKLLHPITPRHTASAMMNIAFPAQWDLSLTQYFMDEVQWNQGSVNPAYNRTDVRLAKHFDFAPGRSLESALIVQNLFGHRYAEFYDQNPIDQRAYLQFKLDF